MDYGDFASRVGLKMSRPVIRAPGAMGLALDLGSNMIRNTAATAAGGLAGIGSAIFNPGGDHGGVVESVSSLGGEPLTEEGRAVSRIAGYPFEKLAQFANFAGGATAEATGSPALGAGVNTAIQSVPAIVGGRGAFSAGRSLGSGKGGASPKAPTAQRQAGLGGVPPTIEELAAKSTAAYARAKK